MNDWLTTILIFLPVAGALLVWLLPLPRHMVGSHAALVSLVEVGLWVVVLERFDFGSGELQFSQQHSWFSEINSSYHVGLYAFSVWLVGLTARATRTRSWRAPSTRGGSAASGRRPTSGSCSSSRARSWVSSPLRTCSSSTPSSRRC